MPMEDLSGFYEPPKLDLNNLPPGWKNEGGVLSFGDHISESGARDAWQYGIIQQTRWLEAEGISQHPLIAESRQAIDWQRSWDHLAGHMDNGLIALNLIARRSGAPAADTLESLVTAHRLNLPDQRESLMTFWKSVFLHGVGVFHLDRFVQAIDPTSLGDDIQLEMHSATDNLLAQPVAFINCLNAARLYAHPRPIEGVLLGGRSTDPFSGDVAAYQHDALRILASNQTQERPFAAWYILALSAVKRSGTSLTRPLLEASEGTAEPDTIAALDRIDQLVSQVVGKKWDGFEGSPRHLDLTDVYGRISGALEYGRTDFYPYGNPYHVYGDDHATATIRSEITEFTKSLRRDS